MAIFPEVNDKKPLTAQDLPPDLEEARKFLNLLDPTAERFSFKAFRARPQSS